MSHVTVSGGLEVDREKVSHVTVSGGVGGIKKQGVTCNGSNDNDLC